LDQYNHQAKDQPEAKSSEESLKNQEEKRY
jgi:hypothetical protein